MKIQFTNYLLLLSTLLLGQNTYRLDHTLYHNKQNFVEMFSSGRQLHVMRRGISSSYNSAYIYMLNADQELIWSLTDFPNLSNCCSVSEITSILVDSDSTFILSGTYLGCDVGVAFFMQFDANSGEILFNSLELDDYWMPTADQIIFLSSGNIMFLGQQYAIFSPDFTLLSRGYIPLYTGSPPFCYKVQSAVPGAANDALLSLALYDGADCGRYFMRVQIGQIDLDNSLEVVDYFPDSEPFSLIHTMYQDETSQYTYLFYNNWKWIFDQNFDVVNGSSYSSSGENIRIKGDANYLYTLWQSEANYNLVRFNKADFSAADTTTVATVPGLEISDFYYTADSISFVGQYVSEHFMNADVTKEYSTLFHATLANGTSLTLDNGANLHLNSIVADVDISPAITTCAMSPFCNAVKLKYENVSISLTNIGTQTINSFYLNSLNEYDCGCGDCTITENWRKKFEAQNMLPGETRTINCGDIYVPENIGPHELCIWLSSSNNYIDSDPTDNIICYTLVSNQQELDNNLTSINLFFDYAGKAIHLSSNEEGKYRLKVFSIDGRLRLQTSVQGNGIVPFMANHGVYLAVITSEDGRKSVKKFVF